MAIDFGIFLVKVDSGAVQIQKYLAIIFSIAKTSSYLKGIQPPKGLWPLVWNHQAN